MKMNLSRRDFMKTNAAVAAAAVAGLAIQLRMWKRRQIKLLNGIKRLAVSVVRVVAC